MKLITKPFRHDQTIREWLDIIMPVDWKTLGAQDNPYGMTQYLKCLQVVLNVFHSFTLVRESWMGSGWWKVSWTKSLGCCAGLFLSRPLGQIARSIKKIQRDLTNAAGHFGMEYMMESGFQHWSIPAVRVQNSRAYSAAQGSPWDMANSCSHPSRQCSNTLQKSSMNQSKEARYLSADSNSRLIDKPAWLAV